MAWWAIGVGLLVELFFVRWLTGFSWRRAALADLTMNAVSSILGLILIPLTGVAWEVFPGIILYNVFDIGTFNPATWAATFLFAVFINSALETVVLRYIFEQTRWGRVFWWLAPANAFSVGIAFGSQFMYPPRT